MSTSSRSSLQSIPIRIAPAGPAAVPTRYHERRRAIQLLMLALAVLIPVTGLFRIDPVGGALVVLGRQVWFSDFFLIFGLWITLATALIFLYSIAGTVFCGWACPQNTLAEWANYMTRLLLGRRAEVSLTGEPIQVTASKNRAANWVVLGLSFVLASMLAALVPMLYFYPPGAVWSFASLRADARLPGSLYWIYSVFVLIILLDVSVLRHFWCRFLCVYRVWQHSFRTRQTLHVAYDAGRSGDCNGCNFCETRCFIELDPRRTEVYSSCINCGECIDACGVMHQKKGEPGLLRFEFGERGARGGPRDAQPSLLSRSRWALPFTLLGLLMFGWGLRTYEPFHLSVDHAEAAPGRAIQDYRIAIANKEYREHSLDVRVSGIPAGTYRLSEERLAVGGTERATLMLSIAPGLKHGLYPVHIEVRADDGWVGRFDIQHLAAAL
jgi:polyferredoxin